MGRGDFLVTLNRGACGLRDYEIHAERSDGWRLLARGSVSDFHGGVLCGVTVAKPNGLRFSTVDVLAESLSSSGVVGHFAFCAESPDVGFTVATDHIGSVPVYLAPGVAGTDLFDVAAVSGCQNIDRASAAEFLQAGYISSPFTIFDGILRLMPGSVMSLTRPATKTRAYWVPREDPDARFDEVVENATDTMFTNLDDLLEAHPRVTLMYSGGEDSRVLARFLSSFKNLNQLRCVSFLDRRNREYRLARASARLLGLDHEVRWRSEDHYARGIQALTGSMGGVFALDHAHSTGLLAEDEADLFIDGWTSDTFLKGLYMPVRQRKILRLAVGLASPSTPQPPAPITGGFKDEVADRRRAKRTLVRDFRMSDADTWMHMWPISDHLDYGFFATNHALRPTASPFMFGNFLDALAPLRAQDKLNRRLFWRMFGRRMGAAGLLPRTDGGLPRLPAGPNVPITFVNRAFVGVGVVSRRVAHQDHRTYGPWQTPTVMKAAAIKLAGSLPNQAVRSALGLLDTGGSTRLEELQAPTAVRVVTVARLIDQGLLPRP